VIKGKIDEIWSIGSKLGWDASRWMPYLTDGNANAAVETSLSVDSFSDRSYDRVDGWYFGGGVDMALDANGKLGRRIPPL
jgi:opacity protein-like surface antigen